MRPGAVWLQFLLANCKIFQVSRIELYQLDGEKKDDTLLINQEEKGKDHFTDKQY